MINLFHPTIFLQPLDRFTLSCSSLVTLGTFSRMAPEELNGSFVTSS